MVQKCSCGSRKFVVQQMTLALVNVPMAMRADGTLIYNDTKAEYSEGWDTSEQPDITCSACSKYYRLERQDEIQLRHGRPVYRLIEMDAAGNEILPAPDRDEPGG